MPQYEDVLTLTYDFLKYLVPQLAKYPRDQKFLLADRMQTLTHDILDDFIVAYYTKDKPEKIARLKPVNVKLERLRFSVRLSHDLKLLSNQHYGVIATKINEIGGSLGNWLKYLDGKK
ncbi:diversity-generating retroelement protein Avd [candidate division KSB1 bacterium]|nr:diversity-generating retroelement protein Avd [candidate division KSB1 bacterium]